MGYMLWQTWDYAIEWIGTNLGFLYKTKAIHNEQELYEYKRALKKEDSEIFMKFFSKGRSKGNHVHVVKVNDEIVFVKTGWRNSACVIWFHKKHTKWSKSRSLRSEMLHAWVPVSNTCYTFVRKANYLIDSQEARNAVKQDRNWKDGEVDEWS